MAQQVPPGQFLDPGVRILVHRRRSYGDRVTTSRGVAIRVRIVLIDKYIFNVPLISPYLLSWGRVTPDRQVI